MAVTYLDNNATTMLAPEALAAMMPYLTDLYGNASSIHQLGQRSRHAIDTARSQVANLIHASDSEICFTGGGTEAINTAIRGLLVARAPRKIPIDPKKSGFDFAIAWCEMGSETKWRDCC